MGFPRRCTYKISFVNFSNGTTEHAFGGRFLEIREDELLRISDAFDDPNLPGQMITTVSFRKLLNSTKVSVEQTGILAVIPLEFCHLVWHEFVLQLTQLVEPEIPDSTPEG